MDEQEGRKRLEILNSLVSSMQQCGIEERVPQQGPSGALYIFLRTLALDESLNLNSEEGLNKARQRIGDYLLQIISERGD